MEFFFKYTVTIGLLPFVNDMIMPMDTPGPCSLCYKYVRYVKLLDWVCG